MQPKKLRKLSIIAGFSLIFCISIFGCNANEHLKRRVGRNGSAKSTSDLDYSLFQTFSLDKVDESNAMTKPRMLENDPLIIPSKEEVAYFHEVKKMTTKSVAEIFCLGKIARVLSGINGDDGQLLDENSRSEVMSHCRKTSNIPSYLPGAEIYALRPVIYSILEDASGPFANRNLAAPALLSIPLLTGITGGAMLTNAVKGVGGIMDLKGLYDWYKEWRNPEEGGATKKDLVDLEFALTAQLARYDSSLTGQIQWLRQEVFNDQVWALTASKKHNLEMRDDIKIAMEETIKAQEERLIQEIGCGESRNCADAWNKQEESMKLAIEEGRERMQIALDTNQMTSAVLGLVNDVQNDVTDIYSNTLSTLQNQKMMLNNQKLIKEQLADLGIGVNYLVNVENERLKWELINANKRKIGNFIEGITGLIAPEYSSVVRMAYDHGQKFIDDLGSLIKSNLSDLGALISISTFGLGMLGALSKIGQPSDLEIMMKLIKQVMTAIEALGNRIDAKVDHVLDKLDDILNLQEITLTNLNVAIGYLTSIMSDIRNVQQQIHYHAFQNSRATFQIYEISYRFLPYSTPPFQGPNLPGIPNVQTMLSTSRKYLTIDAVDAFNTLPTGSSIDGKILDLQGGSSWGIYQTPLSIIYFRDTLIQQSVTKTLPQISQMAGQHWIYGIQWLTNLVENFPAEFRNFPGSSSIDDVLNPARRYQEGLSAIADASVANALRNNYKDKLDKYMNFLVNKRDEFYANHLTVTLDAGLPSEIKIVYRPGIGYIVENFDKVYCKIIDESHFRQNGHCDNQNHLNIWNKGWVLFSRDAALVAIINAAESKSSYHHTRNCLRQRLTCSEYFETYWHVIEVDSKVQFYVVTIKKGRNKEAYSSCYGLYPVDDYVKCHKDYLPPTLRDVRTLAPMKMSVIKNAYKGYLDFETLIPPQLSYQYPVSWYEAKGETLGKMMKWKATNLSIKLQSVAANDFIASLGSGQGGSNEAKELKHAMLLLQRYHDAALPSLSYADTDMADLVREYTSPGKIFDPDVMVSFFTEARTKATAFSYANINDLINDEVYVESVLKLDFLLDINKYVKSSKEVVDSWHTAITNHINTLNQYDVTETPWVDAWTFRLKAAVLCARSGKTYCGPAERLPIPITPVSPVSVTHTIHSFLSKFNVSYFFET